MLTIDLAGQVCLVTGGNRGIGLQIGLTLAQTGSQVILTIDSADGLSVVQFRRGD